MESSERSHLELKFDDAEVEKFARLDALSFFSFLSLIPEMLLRVLCNFLLAPAHCANALLRCMSLLLACPSTINHMK